MKHKWTWRIIEEGKGIWVCTNCGKLCNEITFAFASRSVGDTIVNEECHPRHGRSCHNWVTVANVDGENIWTCATCNSKADNIEELINHKSCCCDVMDNAKLDEALTRSDLEYMVRDLCLWMIAYHKLPTDILNKKATAALDKLNAAVAGYNENMSDTI